MQSAINRPVDPLGRVCIPKELRDKLGIGENDRLEIFLSGNQIIMEKHRTTCVLCGSREGLLQYQENLLCKNCVAAIHSLAQEKEKAAPAAE